MIQSASFLAAGSSLSTVPYTLGFFWLDELTQLGLPSSAMLSYTGATLQPTSNSVLFAVMERGGIPLNTATGALADLTGVTGVSYYHPFLTCVTSNLICYH
jgi:hypothetical protein